MSEKKIELWSCVPTAKGILLVSDRGRLRDTLGRDVGSSAPARRYKGRSGLPRHVLVWRAFRGDIPAGFEVHHINGDRGDNRLDNLMLLSRAGHLSLHRSRPCVACNESGDVMMAFASAAVAGLVFGCSGSTICRACKRTSAHLTRGFVWRYL